MARRQWKIHETSGKHLSRKTTEEETDRENWEKDNCVKNMKDRKRQET